MTMESSPPISLVDFKQYRAGSCDGLKILSFYLKVFLECSCGRLASFLSSFLVIFNNGFVFKCNTRADKVNPF